MADERLVLYGSAQKLDRDFLGRQVEVDQAITLTVYTGSGQLREYLLGMDSTLRNRYVKIKPVVVLDEEGRPKEERIRQEWTSGVILVVWGVDQESGEINVGMVSQVQPIPEDPDSKNKKALIFAQLVMGFLEKDEKGLLENPIAGAIREFSEETGTVIAQGSLGSVIKSIYVPSLSRVNAAPSTFANWDHIVFLEVDLSKVGNVEIANR